MAQTRNRTWYNKNGRDVGMGTWPLGFELLSFCYDCLRCDDFSLVRFWAGRPSPFTLAFDNSALTPVAIFAESTLYRAAVRARFELFSSDCLSGTGGTGDSGTSPLFQRECPSPTNAILPKPARDPSSFLALFELTHSRQTT